MIKKISPYPQNLMDDLNAFTNGETQVDCSSEDKRMGVFAALATLTEREQFVVMLRYQQLLTLEEIGSQLDLTRSRIGQIIQKVYRKLLHPKRYNLYMHGFQGYIDLEANKRADHIVKAQLYAEYRKGYESGYSDAKDGKQSLWDGGCSIAVADLDLSVRAINCLMRANYKTVGDLLAVATIDEINRIRNLGTRCAGEVAYKLNELGIVGTAWDEFRQYWRINT